MGSLLYMTVHGSARQQHIRSWLMAQDIVALYRAALVSLLLFRWLPGYRLIAKKEKNFEKRSWQHTTLKEQTLLQKMLTPGTMLSE